MDKQNEPTVTFQGSAESALRNTESEISNLSFKRWHRRLQFEHEILERTGRASPFKVWKWCNKCCMPCRWFDSIEYEKKISKCCLTFKNFKNVVTIILVAVFFYAFMYSLLGDEVLPGGSVFFVFFLFLTAYLAGYTVTIVGMPGMLGHLIIGITFGNVPREWLPDRDEEFIDECTNIAEKVLLVLALIRGGLLLDLSRMKNRLRFIFLTATFPFFFEFLVVWIASHYLLSLEWDWSALQGSTISIVSLATVTSIMEKNKKNGYGEDKHLSTVLIAAAVVNVVFGFILYFICFTYVMSALSSEGHVSTHWEVLVLILEQSFIGMSVGIIAGFLIAFFPDKRHSEAAGIRIIIVGIGSFGITSFLSSMDMNVAGAMACLLMCLVCTNIWEELGWHQDTNPVLYFYTMAYYIAQPLVLSLLGYEMHFKNNTGEDIGLSLAVFIIGLAGRESMCVLVLQEKSYPTTMKEKIFICIAWLSKGTFQVLLAFSIMPIIEREKEDLSPRAKVFLNKNSETLKRTTILAVLLITPLVCYGLTLLTPKLLTRVEEYPLEDRRDQRGSVFGHRLQRSRLSISRYQDMPTRKFSVKYYSDTGPLENITPEKDRKKEPEEPHRNDPKPASNNKMKTTPKKNPETPPKKNPETPPKKITKFLPNKKNKENPPKK